MSTTTAPPGLDVTEPAARARRLPLTAPAVGVLLLWMVVPLVMTLWFSFQRYSLLDPTVTGFAGLDIHSW